MGKKIQFTTTDGVSYCRFNQVMFSFTTHLVLFEAYQNNNLSQSPTCFSHLPLHPLPFKNHFDHSLCLLDVVQREKMVLVWWYFAATNYILHTFLCQKKCKQYVKGPARPSIPLLSCLSKWLLFSFSTLPSPK